MVDYLAIGSRELLGNPKQPDVFVGVLNAQNCYDLALYRDAEVIQAPPFSELPLSVDQILMA